MTEEDIRNKLGNLKGKRLRFRGFFERYGTIKLALGDPIITLLLVDVSLIETVEKVTDHLWFKMTKGFNAIKPLKKGDCIEFNARVTAYTKGYRGRVEFYEDEYEDIFKPICMDWRLIYPTKIERNNALDSPERQVTQNE